MQVKFYGVRGSMPASGPEFVKYGGNTACVAIELSDGTDIILDSGTGIVKLGDELFSKTTPIHLLLTHNHWDHIQGFPFFTPAYQKKRKIFITPGQTEPREVDAVLKQMSGSWFPINYKELMADVQIRTLPSETETWKIGCATISRKKINHPGGGSAYLIEDQGARVAYVTDNELFPPYPTATSYEEWIEFLDGVDLLIHDAQYVDKDMPVKHGWGHSLIDQAVKLACEAKVKQCALYSHDYTRTDQDIDLSQQEIQDFMIEQKVNCKIFSAFEGQVIKF